jgi:hypothetical protein
VVKAIASPLKQAAVDEWDRRTRGLSFTHGDELLVELARRYLVERGDQALGLAPTRLLAPRKARIWILFWTAARRVDDAVESGATTVEDWRRALAQPSRLTLAERCIEAFLRRPEGAGSGPEVRALLEKGLDGLEREETFDRPRSLHEYLDLIEQKSAPAMIILDRLLFPGETPASVASHARAFAASTQVGDDCRDLRRDMAAGRCFVTLDELKGQPSLMAFARSPLFAAQRVGMSALLLERAEAAAGRFRIAENRATARRLAGFWRHALDSGQVRPTVKSLRLVDGPATAEPSVPSLRAGIRGVLEKRFPPP